MHCKTKTIILRVLIVLIMLGLIAWVKYEKDKTQKIIEQNTQIIRSIAAVGYTQSQNTNLIFELMRITSDQEYASISMEDSANKPFDLSGDKDDLPNNLNQVLLDLREIDTSIRALAVGNLYQKESLEEIIRRLKSKSMDNTLLIELYESRYAEDKVISDKEVEDFEWEYVDDVRSNRNNG